MKNTILWALVGLNAVLLVAFIGQFTRPNSAHAQARPAEYVMIPGEVTGGTGDVVYIIDTSNGKLAAMTYDDARHEMQTMQPIDIARVFSGGTAVTPGAGATPPAGGYRKTPAAR